VGRIGILVPATIEVFACGRAQVVFTLIILRVIAVIATTTVFVQLNPLFSPPVFLLNLPPRVFPVPYRRPCQVCLTLRLNSSARHILLFLLNHAPEISCILVPGMLVPHAPP